MFNKTQVTKENMSVVLETLGKAKWVSRTEAKFLQFILETIYETDFCDACTESVRSEVFTTFSDTVADKMSWGLGYPFSGDTMYDYYSSSCKGYPVVLLGLGKLSFYKEVMVLWMKNTVAMVYEHLRRREFYVQGTMETSDMVKEYLLNKYFFTYDDGSCDDYTYEEEGPYGGAFKDEADLFHYKNGYYPSVL